MTALIDLVPRVNARRAREGRHPLHAARAIVDRRFGLALVEHVYAWPEKRAGRLVETAQVDGRRLARVAFADGSEWFEQHELAPIPSALRFRAFDEIEAHLHARAAETEAAEPHPLRS